MQPFSHHLLGAFVFPQRHRLLNALVDELELAPNFDRFSDYDCFLADRGSSRHFAWPQSAARIAATPPWHLLQPSTWHFSRAAVGQETRLY